MRKALALLAELRQRIPPDVGNHALLCVDGRLAVCIRHHRIPQNFYFEEPDFGREPAEVAAEIAGIIERNCAPVEKVR
jgi:hypothetical protein